MKKLTLTSLLTVFAVSTAHAANIIDNNPLYRPDAGRSYSITTLASHSETTKDWGLTEEFGYGLTNDLAVIVKTAVSEREQFDYMSWDKISVGLNYRMIDAGAWKTDVYGVYGMNPVWGDHQPFMDEMYTDYTWTLGLRAGYVANDFTLAGRVEFDYGNSESFNWADDGVHSLKLGLDGQYLIDEQWNVIAGVEYTGMLDDQFEDAGKWGAKIGANYNIDATKFVGAYISGEIGHATGDWEWADGFGFGLTFGIDF